MAIFSTEAIVLRAYPFGDTSRIVVLLTRDTGKVRMIAKGVRAPKSRMGSSLEPFSEIQVAYYHKSGRDLDLMKSADPLRLHSGFGSDAARLAFGSAALELTDISLTGEEAGPEFYALLADALTRMETASRDRIGIYFGAFELQMAGLLGYQAEFTTCRGCGVATLEGAQFSASQGAVFCPGCATAQGAVETVSERAVAWLRFLNGESGDEPAIENGDRRALREAARLIQLFLNAHLHNFRGLKSLDVLKRLEAMGGKDA